MAFEPVAEVGEIVRGDDLLDRAAGERGLGRDLAEHALGEEDFLVAAGRVHADF